MSELLAAAPFVQPVHLVVLGHPDPTSFCASVARAYRDEVVALDQRVILRDLYALGFDPRLPARGISLKADADVAEDVELLRQADLITLIYPIWFGMPPAIIKGYIDRVLGADFDPGAIMQGGAHPAVAGKRLMLFTASASTRPWLEEKGQWIALRQAFETYLRDIFDLRDAGHTHFDAIVPGLKPRFVEECLSQVHERARAIAAKILQEKRHGQSLAIRHKRVAAIHS
jgi:NAD(P)H dehydrogenase (quinone)